LLDFSDLIASPTFAQRGRHPNSPNSFTRDRKLPLPALIAALLSMRASSQQSFLDTFFAHLHASMGCSAAEMIRGVSDRAFAKARSHLHMPALNWLNDWVIGRAETACVVQRWRDLRLVAADASVLMPAIRKCHRTRFAASGDRRLFALYLPDSELTLHASVHGADVSERAMLMPALECLGPDDVLLHDRGYPAAWLVSLLSERGIRFCMRCDKEVTGWSALKQFLHSGAAQAQVTLSAPSDQDVQDWGCSPDALEVRLVRNVSSNARLRVMATNLDPENFPWECFGELYHKRWRIEEAFKRLKHHMKLESVSGLSQQALIIDVAAKVLADNLASLLCACAQCNDSEPQDTRQVAKRQCNRGYAAAAMLRMLPSVLMFVGDVLAAIYRTVDLLRQTTCRIVGGRSSPRPKNHIKPHAQYAYKG
jgi:hypothetical protein